MRNGWKAVTVFVTAMGAICFLVVHNNENLAMAVATGVFALMHSSLIGEKGGPGDVSVSGPVPTTTDGGKVVGK